MSGKPGHRNWGSIRRQRSRRWQASYVGPDLARHYAPQTFTNKIDAEAWLTKQRSMTERDEWIAPKRQAQHRRAQLKAAQVVSDVIEHIAAPEPADPDSQYVYVLEIVGVATKVGITRSPRIRLKDLARQADSHGHRVARLWLSEATPAAREHEWALLALTGDRRREYLNMDYRLVVKHAESLVPPFVQVDGTDIR